MNIPESPHSLSIDDTLAVLHTGRHGLSHEEARERLAEYGQNTLPGEKPPGILRIFLRQFLSPLIYILLLATLVSLLIGEWNDALFISAVLLINAIIGATQEFSAQRSADALSRLMTTRIRIIRDADAMEINTNELVPGDIVLLESGNKVPADLRLLDSHGLDIDESLMTGESRSVIKHADALLPLHCLPGDRTNMALAGTWINRGRGTGVVTATGLATELGKLALSIMSHERSRPPLLQRMERFVMRIGIAVAGAAVLMAMISLLQGAALKEIFFLAVALTVSAIPEGLPVAITVALTIGMRRMAGRSVITRRLVAVESLGSCTCIASDKTGTLTMNEMTVRHLFLPSQDNNTPMCFRVSGEGMIPEGEIIKPHLAGNEHEQQIIDDMALCATLCNEAFLGHRDHSWISHGDSVDVALLALGHKAGLTRPEALTRYPQLKQIPFEAEERFAATLHEVDGEQQAFVKGALERLIPMCSRMQTADGPEPLDATRLNALMQQLARMGDRVLALASGSIHLLEHEVFSAEHLEGLTLLGLVGMTDPLRPEALQAVQACQRAGIEVRMITGDHPETALVIARELGMTDSSSGIVTGNNLLEADQDPETLDRLILDHRVFARIEPRQKLHIVERLMYHGHFVAVTGDGANDAPALRAAHVGVAMGKKGTDVARESAEIILTDDNFASIVAGIEQGRITYSNIRKVIFLLISTGAAEVVLFLLSLLSGLPLPLLAVQLLWLNLVTNGIQDVALAFDPGEGDEMQRPPRPPREPVFNRIMVERVLLSAITIGCLAFAVFYWLLKQGYDVDTARNSTLMLMVLIENVHVFNSRSEKFSVFAQNPLQNPLLLFGTLTAQLVHIGAMYTPGLSDVLHIKPIPLAHWVDLFWLALIPLFAMEVHKFIRRFVSF